MLGQSTSFAQTVKASQPWRIEQRPALVAAACWWLTFLVMAVITLFTGWASRPVTLYLQLLTSLGAGFQAAWLYQRSQPADTRHVRQGALAGFYLPVASAMIILVIAVMAGLSSFGSLLPLMIPYFLFLPIEIGGCPGRLDLPQDFCSLRIFR